MVLYILELKDLTDIKFLQFHHDVCGGGGDFNSLVYIHVLWDGRLLLNEPDWDACIEEALTDFKICCESPHPVVDSEMKVTGRGSDWCALPFKHAEYVESEVLEQSDNQNSVTKCEC